MANIIKMAILKIGTETQKCISSIFILMSFKLFRLTSCLYVEQVHRKDRSGTSLFVFIANLKFPNEAVYIISP